MVSDLKKADPIKKLRSGENSINGKKLKTKSNLNLNSRFLILQLLNVNFEKRD